MNDPRDDLRQQVLEYFYRLYDQDPTKARTVNTVTLTFRTYKSEEVIGAIEYLEDEKYLKIKKNGKDPLNFHDDMQPCYSVTPKGLRFFVSSKFSAKPASSISFNNKGGIFVFGDNLGTIKQETALSFEEITELVKIIYEAKLSDDKKRELIGDAETIRAQMTKPHPDKGILKKAWDGLQSAATIAQAVQVLQDIAKMLGPYLKNY